MPDVGENINGTEEISIIYHSGTLKGIQYTKY